MDAVKCLPSGADVYDWPRVSHEEQAAPVKFRFRRMDNGRHAVERLDLHYCDWLIVYVDDSALSAYVQMGLIVRRSSGQVVCSSCDEVISEPNLSHEGVLCEDCANEPEPDQFFRGLAYGCILSTLIWAVLLCCAYWWFTWGVR